MKACRLVQQKFHRLVNMSPGEIRRWAKDDRAKCASFPETRKRLPALADLKEKPTSRWTATDCTRAQRVISFNSRHLGQMRRFGCTVRETVALRNWGHNPKCPLPKVGCSK